MHFKNYKVSEKEFDKNAGTCGLLLVAASGVYPVQVVTTICESFLLAA